MLSVLDACLVNGIQISAQVHLQQQNDCDCCGLVLQYNLMPYQVVQIEGANQSEYNVETRVLTVPNSTTITFQLASAPTVSPATGFIYR